MRCRFRPRGPAHARPVPLRKAADRRRRRPAPGRGACPTSDGPDTASDVPSPSGAVDAGAADAGGVAGHAQELHEVGCCDEDRATQAPCDRAGSSVESEPGVVELHDPGHEAVDPHGHQHCDRAQHPDLAAEGCLCHRAQRDDDDLRRQDDVGPDRPADLLPLDRENVHGRIGQCPHVGSLLRALLAMQEPVKDLVDTLEAEISAADHEERHDRPGRERADDERRRNDDELVERRPIGHRPDHGYLAVRGHPGHLLRV